MDMKKEPLAYRMSPRSLDEFYGQEHILRKDKLLYRMIKADRVTSIILSGPPGTGKSSLARIIAYNTNSKFEKINAVTSGVADIKRIVSDAKNMMLNPDGRVILFIDEIHRFNKAQQDALLPHVENGTIILIGSTAENPFFEVNKALISRSSVFILKALSISSMKKIIRNALSDKERGLGEYDILIDDECINQIAEISNGDARIALNILELAIKSSEIGNDGKIIINKKVIEECSQKKNIVFDKSGDSHYDNISAFIKSMRGSDPDAAVFYLARAIYAGEDPMFLARRIIICASEDVGLANPQALQTAVSAAKAVQMIGMPEARIILSQAAIMVAVSPKSNSSYVAISKALHDVENKKTGEIPMHLKNAVTNDMKNAGYGENYKYAHDYNGNYVYQQYLPEEIKDSKYYNPTVNGFENKICDWINKIRKGRQ